MSDYRTIGITVRVFANGAEDRGSIPGRVIPKTQKWYFMPHCLTLNVRIKGKVEQFREWSCTLGVVAIERGTFGSPSTTVADFTSYFLETIHDIRRSMTILF